MQDARSLLGSANSPAPASMAFRRGTSAGVVVIGAGFAGLELARELGKAGIKTTLLDRRNHHLFQPLLYQVATAALSAPDVAEPIRKILRRYRSVRILLGEASEIDVDGRTVILADGERLLYDRLVLASGATHGYFGHDEWAQHAPGLKTIEDAQEIRSRVLRAFESAERSADSAEQRRLMSLAIVGGGPTGVELAGSLAELSRHTLVRDFRNISPEHARITLIEAGPRLLADFSEEISVYARRKLEALGVDVRTGTPVEDISADGVRVAGETLPAGMSIWAAGVRASPLAARLGVETDSSGRLFVDETLAVRGLDNVFALGDIANFPGEDGRPLPGLAQVAKQQGIHLGRGLAGQLSRNEALSPFRYRSRGNTAIVGRHAAVFELGRWKITGWTAWMAWAIIHIYLLVGFQHRILVSLQWLWRYLTYERGARLITGASKPAAGNKEI